MTSTADGSRPVADLALADERVALGKLRVGAVGHLGEAERALEDVTLVLGALALGDITLVDELVDDIALRVEHRAVELAKVIAILCPVGSDTLAGVAIMNVPPEKASEILDEDPCVQTGMMRRELHPCHGFPGDALPAGSAS